MQNLEPIYRDEGDGFVAKSLAWPVADARCKGNIGNTAMPETNFMHKYVELMIVLYLLGVCVVVVSACKKFRFCFESMPYDTGKFVHRWDDNELTFFDHRLQTVQPCTCDNLEAVENASGTVLWIIAFRSGRSSWWPWTMIRCMTKTSNGVSCI